MATDRLETIRQYLIAAGAKEIRSSPEGLYAKCFFHEHYHRSKAMTLSVNVEKGVFVCYSQACGRSGTLATILSERLGMSWRKAKEIHGRLCVPRADVLTMQSLPPWGSRAEKVVEHEVLDPSILGMYDLCPRYMLQRGFTKETLRRWDIGFDSDARRVTFPVFVGGKLVGFTKRRVYETDDPYDPAYKHLGFRKSTVLYGADRVEGVSERFPVVTHESTMSVLWQSQHGVPNAVATLGAKVSEEQVRLLASYPWHVLCFDNDEAGLSATRRVLYGSEVSVKDGRRWQKAKRPGLLHLVERGHIRVVSRWPEGCKDLQECDDPVRVLARAVPVEEWEKRHRQRVVLSSR